MQVMWLGVADDDVAGGAMSSSLPESAACWARRWRWTAPCTCPVAESRAPGGGGQTDGGGGGCGGPYWPMRTPQRDPDDFRIVPSGTV